jgi:hypothetical protein
VLSVVVTSISPPGYTQTVTTEANGTVTTVITNASGEVVQTTTAQGSSSGGGATTGTSVDIHA